MSTQNLHNEAMDLAEEAFLLRNQGKQEESIALIQNALRLESEAALGLKAVVDNEPTRTILFQSASSLAIQAGLFEDAERLLMNGILGYGPESLRDELRDTLEQVNMERHLELHGITLSSDEFQMSLAGPAIGYGMASTDEFLNRLDTIEKMAFRVVERKLERNFRESGAPIKSIRESYQPFISVPRASSFAITIRLGVRPKNLLLFGSDPVEDIVGEIIDTIDLINRDNKKELEKRIPDKTYRNNFIALTRKLAPDKSNVNLVGFTRTIGDQEKRSSFTRTKEKIRVPRSGISIEKDFFSEPVSIVGKLDYADANRKEIHLTSDDNTVYKVIVPAGLLNDIVRPYWDDRVEIRGHKAGDMIHLDDIQQV